MCVQQIRVADLYRPHRYNWVNCGHCAACRQASASRRARRIRYHRPKDTTCYFVTLTYDTDSVPYILKSEVEDVVKQSPSQRRFFNVYRDSYLNRSRSRKIPSSSPTLIDKIEFNSNAPASNVPTRDFTTVVINSKTRTHDPNKVSVCYPADRTNFLKRFRTNLYRSYGKNVPLSYYYAPEYGPTDGRFHMHLLLWLPNYVTYWDVRYHVDKAWPFADSFLNYKGTEIARDPSNYLASYVNCSDNVSKFLQKFFPLRPSHSFHFGHGHELYSFQKIYENFQKGNFKYDALRVDKNGRLYETTLYYPQYIIRSYFPIPKGYSRLTTNEAINIIENPSKYIRLNESVRTPFYCGIKSTSNGPSYPSNIYDVFGNPIYFTKKELQYYINLVNRAYDIYFSFTGKSRYDFSVDIINYHNGRSQALYFDSVSQDRISDQLYEFSNIGDVKEGSVRNDTILDHIEEISVLDPNFFPQNLSITQDYQRKFYGNIKQRKTFHSSD